MYILTTVNAKLLAICLCLGIFCSSVATSASWTHDHKTAGGCTGICTMDGVSQATISTIKDLLFKINKLQRTTDAKVRHPDLTPSQLVHLEGDKQRPFLLVTYAQTIDGMIAMKDEEKTMTSSNLKLSSSESFYLTHALRYIHDGILIGGKTLSTDNPRLNNRLWFGDKQAPDAGSEELPKSQPVPIILDTRLRHVMKLIDSHDSNTVNLKAAGNHDYIIVCCSHECMAKDTNGGENQNVRRIRQYCHVHNVRIELLPCNVNSGGEGDNHTLDLKDVLERVYLRFKLKSVMVEGGASILSAFMSEGNVNLVDCVCVTVCPKVVGQRGLSALGHRQGDKSNPMLEFDPSSVTWAGLGPDCIFLAPCMN